MTAAGPRAETDPAAWNQMAASLPGAHLLQAWEWGALKSRYGWRAERLAWGQCAAAQVLTRSALRGALRVLYVPRGPLLEWGEADRRGQVLDDLQAVARRRGALLLKLDPGLPLAAGLPGAEQDHAAGQAARAELLRRGWRFSPDQIQFRNTVTLDLRRSEADLLAAMKQKTRYNVRLAAKKGVQVRAGGLADLDPLYRMYAETSVRDGFVIRHAGYYHEVWGALLRAGLAQPLIAEVAGEAVAALVLFTFGGTAWYFYGMSRDAHRERMPNYLLQWEAVRWAQAHGCHTYDFWGAPDEFVETDAMWGVWKFKEGFGGQIVRGLGAWDYAPRPALYQLYTRVLPRLLDLLRRRGQAQTRAALAE
ncbi:MAG: peptidoglycan bridge formation glycyltransferase FemA/FemB family protein [Anaerolineales bacterium]|nr:peptidoglycan bridge formation glycyltransferase FemA/FemB family protein [Anaerolineales bacterium]